MDSCCIQACNSVATIPLHETNHMLNRLCKKDSARHSSALLAGSIGTLLQGSVRALLQGTFRALLQGSFKALLQGAVRALLQGAFKAALINATGDTNYALCFWIIL